MLSIAPEWLGLMTTTALVMASGSLCLAVVLLVRYRRLQAHTAALAAEADKLLEKLATIELESEALSERLASTKFEIDRLADTRDQTAGHGMREAIALSRHGASAEQIEDACGLNAGEARLVLSLHGPGRSQADPARIQPYQGSAAP